MTMARRTWNRLMRLALLAGFTTGFATPGPADAVQATCKACNKGKCIDVSGGVKACAEFSNDTCLPFGGTCSPPPT